MRYAYIETGIVKEISRVNPFGIFNKDYASKFVEVPNEVEVGWTYVEKEGYKPPPPVQMPIPSTCTRRQGRLALLHYGLLDDVENVLDNITDPLEKRAAQIEYEADTWEKDNPFLLQMWEHIGGNPSTLDDLFFIASEL